MNDGRQILLDGHRGWTERGLVYHCSASAGRINILLDFDDKKCNLGTCPVWQLLISCDVQADAHCIIVKCYARHGKMEAGRSISLSLAMGRNIRERRNRSSRPLPNRMCSDGICRQCLPASVPRVTRKVRVSSSVHARPSIG